MCTVLLPPGVNPIAVNKYIYIYSRTVIRYNNTWISASPPTCFGLFRPSTGRYWAKGNNNGQLWHIGANIDLKHKHKNGLTFVVPCILIYFSSKTNQMHNISNLFYFGTTLYISEGLSIHHQESKTIYSIRCISYSFCGCLLASRHRTCVVWCMHSLRLLMMDGETDRNI